MSRVSVLVGLVAAAGCADPLILGETRSDISILPLTDLGAFSVGIPHVVTVEVSAVRADGVITLIGLQGDDERYFYTVREFEEDTPEGVPEGFTLPEGVAGYRPSSVTINKDTTFDLPLVYFPQEEGFHRVQLSLDTSGSTSETVRGELRAQADQPEAAIYPFLVDFGQVRVGAVGVGEVTIENRSDLDLSLNVRLPETGEVYTTSAVPFVVPPQSTRPFNFSYEPLTEAAYASNAVFLIGAETVGRPVVLRANNCEEGDPNAYNRDGDSFSVCGGDCDDDDPDVYPGAPEQKDGVDNDCNDIVDDKTDSYDDDGDGYCESDVACDGGALPGDCNDNDARLAPDNIEDCPDDDDPLCRDGLDNDCDGKVDGGTTDVDGDGYTKDGGDCDELNGTIYPGAKELPDDIDNDCDGVVDEFTLLRDDDGDGYCEGTPLKPGRCTLAQPTAAVGDCDDTVDALDPSGVGPHPGVTINPAADESLDRYVDNNCDGFIDEGTPWADADGDGYTGEAGDCDDTNKDIGPQVFEIPGNGIDDDCDEATPATGPL